ncbi:hypothetical protein PanWU01x14_282290 [Parasponia andersonii]|uniref:Uncharacterized protein n=1 Tax=Parasponia andersonii TaxID=3476 RepID=A0A2P5B0T3_PARAD|nr:hypothetical protein PanWU01x14_282290 [Parasponia andersonii]
MGSEAEPGTELSLIPKLPLFSIPPAPSPEHPGMLTPPFQTSLSVPFRWEEQPGKPRPCTALATFSNLSELAPKCLELPPRLLLETKLASPTTVLEVPYVGPTRFQSSSFRMSSECYGSFSPEKGSSLGAMVLSKRGFKVRGWLGSWRRRVLFKGSKEVSGGSYVFPSSVDRESDDDSVGERTEVKMTRIRRGGSFSSLIHPRSPFWATICEGLKQAVPWKTKKLKKEL